MEIKTLAIAMGDFRVLQGTGDSPVLAAGWYVDLATGARVFYDPKTQNFYTLAGGVYIPLSYMNPAPKQVAVAPGDRLKITVSFNYSGPAITGAIIRYCIGVYGALGFNEAMVAENTRNLALATVPPAAYTDEYTFTIPTSIGSDWNDIYCKIYGGSPGVPQTLFGYENALSIAGLTPSISLFTIKDFAKV